MPSRVLLVDDHKIIRDVIRDHLEKSTGHEVVGEAGDGLTAVKMARRLKPDVVVMDIGMPDLNGVEATRQVLAACPGTRVIALSMHTDPAIIRRMLKAGASGYLVKDCAVDELAEALEHVLAGNAYLSQVVTNVVVGDYVERVTDGSGVEALSGREREVLQMLAEGNGTKEIALRLHVSTKTVETHRQHLMKKLKIDNVPDLTRYAIREGLTSLD